MDPELLQSLSKYPFIHDLLFHDSIELKQNKTCIEKCKEKDCLSLYETRKDTDEYICSKGYNALLVTFDEVQYIFNGLIFTDNRSVPAGRKEVRKEWIVERSS